MERKKKKKEKRAKETCDTENNDKQHAGMSLTGQVCHGCVIHSTCVLLTVQVCHSHYRCVTGV